MEEYNSRRKLDLFIIAGLHFVEDENGGRLRRSKYEKRPSANDTNADGSFNKIYGYLCHCIAFAFACLPLPVREYIFLGFVALRVYQSLWIFEWLDEWDERLFIPPCQMVKNNKHRHLMFMSETSLYRMNRPLYTNVVLISAWFLSTYMGRGFPFWVDCFCAFSGRVDLVRLTLVQIPYIWFGNLPRKPPDKFKQNMDQRMDDANNREAEPAVQGNWTDPKEEGSRSKRRRTKYEKRRLRRSKYEKRPSANNFSDNEKPFIPILSPKPVYSLELGKRTWRYRKTVKSVFLATHS